MDLQTDYTWRARRWKPEDVCEVGIEREENSATGDRKCSYFVVRFSGQPGLGDGDGIVALLSEDRRVFRREVFVKKELHETRTISLFAKPAAYFRAAVIWSLVSCG